MQSKNRFEICGEDINIYVRNLGKLALATYREDYFDELSNVTWSKKGNYLYSNKLKKYLHIYIMEKWYGGETVNEMRNKDWIIEHMNNNGFDCRISNLEFLIKGHNVSKGQTLDIESKKLRHHIALNMFKDFSTGLYQITIFFNDDVIIKNYTTDKPRILNALKLLYKCDYRFVVHDAENILLNYDLENKIDISKLKCIDVKAEYPEPIQLSEEEKGRAFIERDGKFYIIIGNNNTWIDSIHYEKGWKLKE